MSFVCGLHVFWGNILFWKAMRAHSRYHFLLCHWTVNLFLLFKRLSSDKQGINILCFYQLYQQSAQIFPRILLNLDWPEAVTQSPLTVLPKELTSKFLSLFSKQDGQWWAANSLGTHSPKCGTQPLVLLQRPRLGEPSQDTCKESREGAGCPGALRIALVQTLLLYALCGRPWVTMCHKKRSRSP